MGDIGDTLTKAGWVEVSPGGGLWRAPDDDTPSGRKWTTYNAAVEALRRQGAEPSSPDEPKRRGRPRKTPEA